MKKAKSREEFSSPVIKLSKEQASYICSNPNCRKSTIAPSKTDESSVEYCGEIAHIEAESKGGPRHNVSMSTAARRSINNALFLCCNCARLIDKNNGIDYSVKELQEWKTEHKKWVQNNLNKTISKNMPLISSINQSGGISAQIVNINSGSVSPTDASNQHDREIFIKSEEILNEDLLYDLRSTIDADSSCFVEEKRALSDIKEFFLKTKNSFINPKLEKAKNSFIIALQPCNDFITSNFDSWPYTQGESNFRIQLHPQYLRDTQHRLRLEGDHEKWIEMNETLQQLFAEMYKKYQLLRRMVKTQIKI